jgi:hypothetical protein
MAKAPREEVVQEVQRYPANAQADHDESYHGAGEMEKCPERCPPLASRMRCKAARTVPTGGIGKHAVRQCAPSLPTRNFFGGRQLRV